MAEQKLFYEDVEKGDEAKELSHELTRTDLVTYAGASGDFNPIHIDVDFAKQVGLPSNILHGLYTMAQVARANVSAAGGDPRSLRRLSVQFRGMGFPEQEITVSGTVKEVSDGYVVIETVAEQSGNQIIRNAEAEIEA